VVGSAPASLSNVRSEVSLAMAEAAARMPACDTVRCGRGCSVAPLNDIVALLVDIERLGDASMCTTCVLGDALFGSLGVVVDCCWLLSLFCSAAVVVDVDDAIASDFAAIVSAFSSVDNDSVATVVDGVDVFVDVGGNDVVVDVVIVGVFDVGEIGC